jgi:hypothetical protein
VVNLSPSYDRPLNHVRSLGLKNMAERREEDRIEVCLDAVWDGTMGKYTARITDLSEGGCYIDSLCEAYVGEVIHFNMQLPDGEWLELTGEIAHHTPQFGFGVRFIDLSDSVRQKLLAMLATQAQAGDTSTQDS